VNAIERSTSLWLLEQPEYKRRWSDESWEARVDVVLRQRLLDRCEEPHLWFEPSPVGPKPVARTPRQLAELLGEDEDFTTLAALYAPGSGTTNTLLDLLLDLLGDEHVPQAAPLRYKASGIAKRHDRERAWKAQRREDREGFTDNGSPSMPDPPRFTTVDFLKPAYWRHRGKFDIPNERFISFASSASLLSPTTPIGWAGWSADERASAVLGLLEGDSHAHGQRPESALPLLTALADLLPRVTAPGEEFSTGPTPKGETVEDAYNAHVVRLGLSTEDVNSWRPHAPRRGRPRKGAQEAELSWTPSTVSSHSFTYRSTSTSNPTSTRACSRKPSWISDSPCRGRRSTIV
jgi:hypothetical protein